MPCKDIAYEIKSVGPADGQAEGEFTAYASVFGNVDSYGDVVAKGAFERTLKEWSARDAELPLLWGHDTSNPDHNLGTVVHAEEDDHGLLVKCQIDLEGPKGPQVYRLLKGKRVNQMSFAFDIDQYAVDTDEEVRTLKELTLHEVSIVPLGANQETEILTVKAGQLAHTIELGGSEIDTPAIKALQEVATRLTEVLERVITGTTEKASGTGTANGSTRKSEPEEPSPNPSVDSWLTAIQIANQTRRISA